MNEEQKLPYDPATVAAQVPTGAWVKGSRSNANGGSCVEVAVNPEGGIFLRDSKTPGLALSYTAAEWSAFVLGAKDGEFDSIL